MHVLFSTHQNFLEKWRQKKNQQLKLKVEDYTILNIANKVQIVKVILQNAVVYVSYVETTGWIISVALFKFSEYKTETTVKANGMTNDDDDEKKKK